MGRPLGETHSVSQEFHENLGKQHRLKRSLLRAPQAGHGKESPHRDGSRRVEASGLEHTRGTTGAWKRGAWPTQGSKEGGLEEHEGRRQL